MSTLCCTTTIVGVLLLNATLTVKAHEANAHKAVGWDKFTDAVIAKLAQKKQNVVWLLWGSFAIKKAKIVPASSNLVLTAAHPSGLSAHKGFFGCKHFSKCNEYLVKHKQEPVKWQI